MKNFQSFLEEITIKGNPAVPGEGGKKEGESEYLKDVEARAKQRLELRPGDISRRGPMGQPMPSQTEMRLGRELMELLGQSMRYTSGHEDELSGLATKIFQSMYNDLIERYEIEVDIKIVKPGKVKQFMDEQEEEQENPVEPEFQEVVEEDIKNEVFKRKIANLIIQGEAKNTKHILHSDDVKDGLEEIYGERDGKKVFELWDKMTKIADKLDWIIPTDLRAEMMEQMPEGMAGACSVDWKPKEEKEESQEEEEAEEFFGGEEEAEEEYSEEDEAPMERFDKTPIIRARGVDFPMLLHESVKGLFELLSIPGIPEDERTANIALSNTGLSDEPEDWQYGPEIASDLRDFINLNKDIDKYPNIREEVYRMMVDKETMPTKRFLELMRGILSKTAQARRDVDRLVAKVIEDKEAMEQFKKDEEEYQQKMKDWEEQQKKGPKQPTTEQQPKVEEPVEEVPVDPKTMSQREIQSMIDKALDDNDYDTARYWSQYLKESSDTKKIYQREIQMLLEGKNPHML
jgi:hypothetical protein